MPTDAELANFYRWGTYTKWGVEGASGSFGIDVQVDFAYLCDDS